MKNTYLQPTIRRIELKRNNMLLVNSIDSIQMSGNTATTTDGTYNTLSRRNSFWDEEGI